MRFKFFTFLVLASILLFRAPLFAEGFWERLFKNKEEFRLGISPEGTRKKVTQWKTGFYYIAKGANVPIVMATLDFENKQIKISEPFYTTISKEKDFEYFHTFFRGVKGKHKKLS